MPFFERPGGKKIKQLIDKGVLGEIHVWELDRLGRDIRDILDVIHFFTERQICITFISQGLRTIEKNGKQNAITKLILSILGCVSEMERSQLRERQLEGIALAKAQGKYQGRKKGSSESILKFLSKPQNAKALNYLKKGLSCTETSQLSGVHINTVGKIKKFGLKNVSASR